MSVIGHVKPGHKCWPPVGFAGRLTWAATGGNPYERSNEACEGDVWECDVCRDLFVCVANGSTYGEPWRRMSYAEERRFRKEQRKIARGFDAASQK